MELRRGLRGLGGFGKAIVITGTLGGLLHSPRRTLRAWRASGAGGNNLFAATIEHDYPRLLERTLADLRRELGVPTDGLASRHALHSAAPRPEASPRGESGGRDPEAPRARRRCRDRRASGHPRGTRAVPPAALSCADGARRRHRVDRFSSFRETMYAGDTVGLPPFDDARALGRQRPLRRHARAEADALCLAGDRHDRQHGRRRSAGGLPGADARSGHPYRRRSGGWRLHARLGRDGSDLLI